VNGEKAIVGTYQNGFKTGIWKWYAINGNLDSAITYLSGTYNGSVEKYYRNGTLQSEAEYVHGKIDGEHYTYFENGELESTITYNNSIRSGPFTKWNANGFKRESGVYLNDKLDGVNFRWYRHGEYSTITTYNNGILHGIMRIYSPSGVIKKETFYHLDTPVCQIEYFDNSRMKQVLVYKNDEIVFQKDWNNLGLETTDAENKLGITTKIELFESGNLRSETSFKGENLHGLALAFNEDRSLQYLSLYIEGEQVFRRNILEPEKEQQDLLYPNSALEVIVKIEEEEI